ncbi:MAG: hypothetical protein QOI10_3794 [Solirubrobacterales bacterium]|jgi:hypothetical protein|nr:hypothetical protein [Solirubrobacterales bacterium]
MGIGVSIFLIAIGAILTFAVNLSVSGLDLSTVGVILMVVGGVGLAASMLLFGGPAWGGRRTVVSDTYVEDGSVDPVVRRRVDY